MPASDISRLSITGQPRSDMASQMARDVARREIRHRIEMGQLDVKDENGIKREWRDIYRQEYYKYYAVLLQQEQPSERVIYLPTDNPSATKHYHKHASVRFSRYNSLLVVVNDFKRVSEGSLNFPIEDDISLETKEAFLVDWPGPLDRPDDQHIKRKITDYIEKVWQHDSQRRIRYCSSSCDNQRRVILRLLTEFLHRNGSLDASSITRLLLSPEQTEIQKDDGNRKPLETLQKYLLLGKRSEAIKYAKTRKLWDHAQCLAFLDKYQPPNTINYVKDKSILKEDSIVQLNNEYISSIDSGILNTVYRSLLNRILQSDPDSVHLVKHPDVGDETYEFAMLSANDCEMEFDQSNEIFKLVIAIKKATTTPIMSNGHLISLGFTTLDTYDPIEDMSYRSNLSFKQNDTYAARTLTISNIDMLILNEIWEYCLNLAHGTTDPSSYDYIINLVPFKLVFASLLLDYGLHGMFAYYLASIKHALARLKQQPHQERDLFYDWDTIERSAELLSSVWDTYLKRSEFSMYYALQSYEPSIPPATVDPHGLPPPTLDTFQSHTSKQANHLNEITADRLDSSSQDYPSLPYQGNGAFLMSQSLPQIRAPYMGPSSIPPSFNNQPPPPPIPEESVNDFNPDPEPSEEEAVVNHDSRTLQRNQNQSQQAPLQYQNQYSHTQQQQPMYNNDYSNESSRRTSQDVPPFSPLNYSQSNNTTHDKNAKTMTSSSPVENNRGSYGNSMMTDSFNALSPISDDLPRHELSRQEQPLPPPPLPLKQNQSKQEQSRQESGASRNSDRSKTDESQQPGFIANIAGSVRAFLPKSNSKQMILPDDSSKAIVYDEKRRTWVDTTKGEDEETDDYNEPPPVAAPVKSPPTYSFANKSAKTRYPKPRFTGP